MTTTHFRKNRVQPIHWLKIGFIGLVAAAGFGLLALPTKADEVKQRNMQTTGQNALSNTSVQQNTQTGEIETKEIRANKFHTSNDYDYLRGAGESRYNPIGQGSKQATDRSGASNTSVEQNTQNIKILHDRRPIIYPR